MKSEVLNKLNDGEQLVEMQECTLHDMIVIEVTLHKCVSIFGFRKIKTCVPILFYIKRISKSIFKIL